MKRCLTRHTPLVLACLLACSGVYAETLDEAWQRAEASSRQLKADTLNAEAAGQGVAAAEAAAGPSVGASAQWQKLDHAITGTMDTSGLAAAMPAPLRSQFPSRLEAPLSEDHLATAEVKVTLPVYTGGRLTSMADAARARENSARHGVARSRLDVRLDVAEAYFNVLRASEALKVATLYQDTLVAYRRDVGNAFHKGIVSRGDVSGAEVALAEARQKVIAAREAVSLSRAAYNRLTGRPLDQVVALQTVDFAREQRSLAQLSDTALSRRPELGQLRELKTALTEQARSVRAEASPQLGVFAAYTWVDNPYLTRKGVGSVGIGVKWDAFDSGLVKSRAAVSERQAAALGEQEEDARSLIRLDVQRGLSLEIEAAERLVVARAALDSAVTWQDITLDRYHNGLANQTEVLMAAAKKADSQRNLFNARFDHALAILRLRRAIGEL